MLDDITSVRWAERVATGQATINGVDISDLTEALGWAEEIADGAADGEAAGLSASEQEVFQTLVERRVPLRAIEERMIEETLKATGGNKVEAARILGISRRTLYRRSIPPTDSSS